MRAGSADFSLQTLDSGLQTPLAHAPIEYDILTNRPLSACAGVGRRCNVRGMIRPISRRRFLARSVACSAIALSAPALFSAHTVPETNGLSVDFHVHLDNSTLEKVLELSRERGVKFGIVEHAGTRANQYPTLLSSDDELRRYLRMLDGKPVFKGIQAEWTDWMSCFSPGALAGLDYVLSDAMSFPGKDGRHVKLWTPEASQQVDMSDRQAFMDRFVDWHVEVMAREPLDILANTTWLPSGMLEQWELYWTPPRMKKVIDTALKYGVALEISSHYDLPKLPFLKLAKAAGAKFSFGSNGRYPNMGRLGYCLEMARQLDLKLADMFRPAPDGQKAFQRRKLR
jgi:histidinol phosphatase-like PHP family hydrolase